MLYQYILYIYYYIQYEQFVNNFFRFNHCIYFPNKVKLSYSFDTRHADRKADLMASQTEQLQTPFFVIDEPILNHYYDMLTESLSSNWSNYLIGYSFKTNSLPWLVSYVKKRGAYAEVVSEDEYSLAKYMGYNDSEIVYNGPYKGERSFCNVLLSNGINQSSPFSSRQDL